jgi:hypothetical protein
VNGRSSAGEKISKFKERVSKHFKRTVTDLSMLSICDAKGERPLQLSDMDLFPRRSAESVKENPHPSHTSDHTPTAL